MADGTKQKSESLMKEKKKEYENWLPIGITNLLLGPD